MITYCCGDTDAYEKFKTYYRATDDDILDWRSVNGFEIVVRMKDNSIIRFDSSTNTFGYLKRHDVDLRGNYTMSDDEYKHEFAIKLKRLMRSMRITQAQLSEDTGISQVSISKYVNGRGLPDCRNLTRIANALGCSVSELTYFE